MDGRYAQPTYKTCCMKRNPLARTSFYLGAGPDRLGSWALRAHVGSTSGLRFHLHASHANGAKPLAKASYACLASYGMHIMKMNAITCILISYNVGYSRKKGSCS